MQFLTLTDVSLVDMSKIINIHSYYYTSIRAIIFT
jgi:hypothetical protein